jgi:hypothetical protein
MAGQILIVSPSQDEYEDARLTLKNPEGFKPSSKSKGKAKPNSRKG